METRSKSRRFLRITLWACGLTAALVIAAFMVISLQIGADVAAASRTAMQNHAGDGVEALLAYVEDTRQSLRDRNRAVWALGQLGDRRALPVLRKLYSGEPCHHETALCQRELRKAIALAEGGINATAIVWRHPSAR